MHIMNDKLSKIMYTILVIIATAQETRTKLLAVKIVTPEFKRS